MENPGVDGGITLEWILKKKAWNAQNVSISEERPVTGCISNRNTHSNSKRGEEFLDKLSGP